MSSIIYKEMKSYLNSAIPYIATVFFLVASAVWFFYIYNFELYDEANMRGYFATYPLLFAILIPALTMRSFSDEMKTGTYEILTSFPIQELQLVIAKFLSSFILLLGILSITLAIPICMSSLGNFDKGVLFTQYLGVILLGATCIAIGQFISSLTKNQITAFLVTLLILLVIIFMGSTESLLPKDIFQFVNWISLKFHFDSFNKGIIDFRDLVYFLSLTVFFIFLNQQRLLFKKYN